MAEPREGGQLIARSSEGGKAVGFATVGDRARGGTGAPAEPLPRPVRD